MSYITFSKISFHSSVWVFSPWLLHPQIHKQLVVFHDNIHDSYIKLSVDCHNAYFLFRFIWSNYADGNCRVFKHIHRNTRKDLYCFWNVSHLHSSVHYMFCLMVKWQSLNQVFKMHVYLSLPIRLTAACINLSCLKVQKDYAAVKC